MKEVLVVYYSQTGQLHDIISKITSGLNDDNINITYFEIVPEKPFEFPWNKNAFFDAFPESFLQIPASFIPPSEEILSKEYDLVLLGHQVWYLTPSIPLNSFLKSTYASKLLKNTPVVTVIGARNMWIMAQEKVKKLLVSREAKLVGNIALVDRHINHISVITIVHWMMKGKKNKMWGVFPKPGVSDEDIKNATKFGNPIKKALLEDDFLELQNKLLQLDAITIKPFLVIADQRANILFSKWANLIIKKGPAGDPNRKNWLRLFNFYLLFAIWVIAPIVFIVFLLTYIPLYRKMNRDKKYYSSVHLK
jgi:flavodoxin